MYTVPLPNSGNVETIEFSAEDDAVDGEPGVTLIKWLLLRKAFEEFARKSLIPIDALAKFGLPKMPYTNSILFDPSYNLIWKLAFEAEANLLHRMFLNSIVSTRFGALPFNW